MGAQKKNKTKTQKPKSPRRLFGCRSRRLGAFWDAFVYSPNLQISHFQVSNLTFIFFPALCAKSPAGAASKQAFFVLSS
jgi:hypothetical protein